jgi:hypothetical protein
VVGAVNRGRVLLVAGAVVVAVGSTVFSSLAFVASDLVADRQWSTVSIPRQGVPDMFGVPVPAGATDFLSHTEGSQDWYGAVVFRFPDGGVEPWLKASGLARAPTPRSGARVDDAVAHIAARAHPAGVVRVVGLDGPPPLLKADGGVSLYRAGALLEWEDQAWALLSASDT